MKPDEACDHELEADKAFEALKAHFSQLKGPAEGGGRRYFLEFVDGRPVFRPDEFDFAFAKIFSGVCYPGVNDDDDDAIVPLKLAKEFPRKNS